MRMPLRILHVEDEPRDAELVALTLEEAGIPCVTQRVDTAEAFAEALKRGNLDLVLSHFSLPSFDGASALALARALQPEAPFILVSGVLGEEAAVESLVAGATDYVLKGRLARLAPAVRRAIAEAENRRARRLAEEARRASEVRYRHLFEFSKDGLLLMDGSTFRILDASPSFLELLELARSDVVGHTIGELWPGGEAACAAALQELFRRDEGQAPDLQLPRADGKAVHVDVVSKAYVVEGRRLVQCSLRDIGERRRLEEELRQAQKLEAVGRLAGGVAHDFNNMLAVIISYSELDLSTTTLDQALRDDLEQIRDAGRRGAALTQQLLAFSRRQLLQPVLVSLNGVVGNMLDMLGRLIGEDVALRVRLGEDLGCVRADPVQLEQVLMNLVINARDAMPHGGALDIETAAVAVDEAFAAIHPDVTPGPYIALTVSDSGCGMDETTLRRIFEPFFTTKGPGKGTGLGLATVYGIVRQSGGAIEVDSRVGSGTRFRIYLPRQEGTPFHHEAERAVAPAAGTQAILVVDDDDGVRRALERVLEPAGYRVLSVSSGTEAIRLFQAGEQRIDLLLTDVVMAGMDGTTLAQRIRALGPEVRVLFMSGYLDEELVNHGLPPAADFMRKPFTISEVLTRVRRALASPVASGGPVPG